MRAGEPGGSPPRARSRRAGSDARGSLERPLAWVGRAAASRRAGRRSAATAYASAKSGYAGVIGAPECAVDAAVKREGSPRLGDCLAVIVTAFTVIADWCADIGSGVRRSRQSWRSSSMMGAPTSPSTFSFSPSWAAPTSHAGAPRVVRRGPCSKASHQSPMRSDESAFTTASTDDHEQPSAGARARIPPSRVRVDEHEQPIVRSRRRIALHDDIDRRSVSALPVRRRTHRSLVPAEPWPRWP
jgi:hypothetical protein